MAFRPCIDLRNGHVVQIVGGSLTDAGDRVRTHFVSARQPADYARLYQRDGLVGGHVVMLGPGNEAAACQALQAYPGGLQVGGGITPDNAGRYLDAGASHVIVTSYLFSKGRLDLARLQAIRDAVGRERLVVDLSCRLGEDGAYRVATDRWQTVTDAVLGPALFAQLESSCDEFLVHAADVEGLTRGIDSRLVALLGEWVTRPTTYAGGARTLADIETVARLSGGKVDLTIGSALDIFGGSGVCYEDAARLGRKQGSTRPGPQPQPG